MIGHPPGGSEIGEDEVMNGWNEDIDDPIEDINVPEDEVLPINWGQGPFGLGDWAREIHDWNFDNLAEVDDDILTIGTIQPTQFLHFNNWMIKELYFAKLAMNHMSHIPQFYEYEDSNHEILLDEDELMNLASIIKVCSDNNRTYELTVFYISHYGENRYNDSTPIYRSIKIQRMIIGLNYLWRWDLGVDTGLLSDHTTKLMIQAGYPAEGTAPLNVLGGVVGPVGGGVWGNVP